MPSLIPAHIQTKNATREFWSYHCRDCFWSMCIQEALALDEHMPRETRRKALQSYLFWRDRYKRAVRMFHLMIKYSPEAVVLPLPG